MNDTTRKRKPLISQSNKEGLRNPWVLGWLASIIIVLAVNVGFIVTAVVTNPGLVDKNYYKRGRNFEKEVTERRKLRERLGWDMKLVASTRPLINQPVQYTFSVHDKKGAPVNGDRALLAIYRPSDASADFKAEMKQIAPGTYSAEVRFPLKGVWDLTVSLRKGKDVLGIQRRIHVFAQ